MTFRKTLLERLADPPAPQVRDLPGNLDQAMDSIRNNLQRLLNSRRGSSSTAPNYGTSGFSDFFRGQASVESLRDEIQETIALYEPRLVDVEVSLTPEETDIFRVHFEITGSVVSEDEEAPAAFHTVLEGSGAIKVVRR